MRCPGCREEMVIVEVEAVELDVCPDGHGLWFDADELRQLFELAGVPDGMHGLESRLSSLPRRAGKRRPCPRCRARMVHVGALGADGPVILDRCPHGDGLWFDDGELEAVLRADLAEDDEALARIRAHLGGFLDARPSAESQDTGR